MNLGVPRAQAQRDKQRFFLRTLRELLIGHLDFRFLALTETVRTDCCHFNTPILWYFVTATLGNQEHSMYASIREHKIFRNKFFEHVKLLHRKLYKSLQGENKEVLSK